MKGSTKNVLRTIVRVLIAVFKLIKKNKSITLVLMLMLVLAVASCVNSSIVIVKHPSPGITIDVDTTGNAHVSLTNDTVR